MPVSGILFLYSNEIVTILFKRGSFDAYSVKLSSDFLRYLGLSLPFTAIISIAGNLYVAAQLIRASIGYQIVSNLLLILLVYLSLRWLGYIGYPIAFLAINVLNVLIVYIFCRLFFPFIRYTHILKYLGILIGCNVLIVFALKGIGYLFSNLSAFMVVFFGGFIYMMAVLIINFVFHLNKDFNAFLAIIHQKITGKK